MIKQFDTFIKKDPDLIITDIQDIRSSDFLPLDELNQLKSENFDRDYLEGALIINIDGKVMSDLSMYDLIDQLWAYMLNAVEELMVDRKSRSFFTFPDQPLPVEVKVVNMVALDFTVGRQTVRVLTQEFYNVIISKSSTFFSALTNFFGENDLYKPQFEQIRRLEQIYKSSYN